MTQALAVVIGILVAAVIVFLMYKYPQFRKYGTFALILIPGIVVLILLLFKKKDPAKEQGDFAAKITEIAQDLGEANKIATLKAQFAKEKNDEKMKQLDQITSIDDKTERRKQLTDLIG